MAEEFRREGIPSETGGHSPERFRSADEIVVSPGVPLDIGPLAEARRSGVSVVSEVEAAFRYLEGDLVAVTGSNGKTTTTSLVGHILQQGSRRVQVGGNIGTPLSALVDSSRRETINVIEVSSFQLDGVRTFHPHVGLLLNVTPDHLDRYPDFEAYRRSKLRLFESQSDEDYAVVNRDDPNVFPLPADVRSRRREFSLRRDLDQGACFRNGFLVVDRNPVLAGAEVPLRGVHNLENILAALLVAGIYGIDREDAARAIRSFRPVAHRLEPVGSIGGVEFVNDSKATNVDSAIKAVESFSSPVVVILGGTDKGGSLEPLVEAMKQRVRHAVLIGAAADRFERAISGAFPTSRGRSMSEAVRLAIDSARSGDVVLLAPACASFDMYNNYEERGNDFRNVVRAHQGFMNGKNA